MKRLIVFTALFSVGILAVWMISEAYVTYQAKAQSNTTPIKGYDETDEMARAQSEALAVPATGADRKIAPVFDSTGAVVSDPTGTILNSNQSGAAAFPMTSADVKIAPVFDSTGAIVSDPTGTILNANQSGAAAFPMASADVKIAPVFDSTGAIVSDPTGTLLNVSTP